MQGMLKNWASRTLAKIIYASGIINKRVSPKKGDLELRESLSLKKKKALITIHCSFLHCFKLFMCYLYLPHLAYPLC